MCFCWFIPDVLAASVDCFILSRLPARRYINLRPWASSSCQHFYAIACELKQSGVLLAGSRRWCSSLCNCASLGNILRACWSAGMAQMKQFNQTWGKVRDREAHISAWCGIAWRRQQCNARHCKAKQFNGENHWLIDKNNALWSWIPGNPWQAATGSLHCITCLLVASFVVSSALQGCSPSRENVEAACHLVVYRRNGDRKWDRSLQVQY